MTASTHLAPLSPLDRAIDRLQHDASDGGCAFDDLAAPSWAAYRGSRQRFLQSPSSPPVAGPRLAPLEGGDGR
jgi:hypothetical protein